MSYPVAGPNPKMEEPLWEAPQSTDQTPLPAAGRAEMGHFAMPMWDKTQFGLPGVQVSIHADPMLRS